MSAPRLRIDLTKIQENAQVLVQRMGAHGIGVTGVTKAFLGYQPIANAMRRGGVTGLGDSRLQNMVRLRERGNNDDPLPESDRGHCPLWLIRSPMLSEAASVVTLTDISSNTELDVVAALAAAACKQNRVHGIVLMIELGDLREGILPGQLQRFIAKMMRFKAIELRGLATNLACMSGVIPDSRNMSELSRIASATEQDHGLTLQIVSGGNSANMNWAASLTSNGQRGRINNLRLGEAILLGHETTERKKIDGLHTDAFSLIGEVIESGRKPIRATGRVGQVAITGFEASETPRDEANRTPDASRNQAIVALGQQDTDAQGLTPPRDIRLIGASSDHLVLDTGSTHLRVGSEVAFALDYSALMRAMTSPFVTRETTHASLDVRTEIACH